MATRMGPAAGILPMTNSNGPSTVRRRAAGTKPVRGFVPPPPARLVKVCVIVSTRSNPGTCALTLTKTSGNKMQTARNTFIFDLKYITLGY